LPDPNLHKDCGSKTFSHFGEILQTKGKKKKKKKKLNTLLPSILINYFDQKCQLLVAGMIHIQKEDE
jgi:hypothetical protein